MTTRATRQAQNWFRQPSFVRNLILLGAGAMALWFAWLPPFPALENAVRDFLMRTHAQHGVENRIVIIDIDEPSLATLGPWPWPRSRIADLIEILLVRHKARAVALDMVFPEPADRTGDERLAALAEHGPITLATAFDFVKRHPPLRQGVPGIGNPTHKTSSIHASGYLGNHAGLASARCIGNIGFIPDADGMLRHLPLNVRFADMSYPTLSLALLACSDKAMAERAEQLIHTNDGSWHLPFRYSLDSYLVIPAKEVLMERIPADFFVDRYAFVGSSALGIADKVATPLAPSVSGVMVHAQALSALLDAAYGRDEQSWPSKGILASWMALSLILFGWSLPRLSPWSALTLLVLLSSTWCVIVWIAYPHAPDLPLSSPLLTYLLLLAVAVPYEWWNVHRQFRSLARTFSRYVAPTVIAEILKQPDFQPLQPGLREITVLIADMENYTKHIAHLPLGEAAHLTRDFLECLTQPVLETGGTIDRYTGDGIVAFWGAPLLTPDHAHRALTAAMKIHARVASFSRDRSKNGLPAVRVRIGIESGQALVGDLGTTFRSTYTAVGDCINFAAKLQQAARFLRVDIIVGPGTFAQLRDGHDLVFIGRLEIEDMTFECWSPQAGSSQAR